MKKINRKSLLLLAIGALLISFTFILKHYFPIEDFWQGAIIGVGIGLMIYSIILASRENGNNVTNT